MSAGFTALAGVKAFEPPFVIGMLALLPDLVERKFIAAAPNELWVANITYIPTYPGFLFLAVVLDAYSRRIVGWATSSTMRTQLVLDALNMAYSGDDRTMWFITRTRDAVHIHCIWFAVPRSQRSPIDGLSRRLLRQCHVRKF